MASQIKPRLTSISSLILFIIFGVLLSLLMYETFLSKNFEPLDLAISNWAVANNYDSILRSFLTIITKATASSVMAVLTIIATASLWFKKLKRESVIFFAGFFSTLTIVAILKSVVARIRPEGAILFHETSGSFPSAHAALSLFFFGFLGYLLASKTKNQLYIIAALAISAIIDFSRIYLNVHWASDVLGGFLLSAAILSLCVGILETKRLK